MVSDEAVRPSVAVLTIPSDIYIIIAVLLIKLVPFLFLFTCYYYSLPSSEIVHVLHALLAIIKRSNDIISMKGNSWLISTNCQ
jgi:hypothetical protein